MAMMKVDIRHSTMKDNEKFRNISRNWSS